MKYKYEYIGTNVLFLNSETNINRNRGTNVLFVLNSETNIDRNRGTNIFLK